MRRERERGDREKGRRRRQILRLSPSLIDATLGFFFFLSLIIVFSSLVVFFLVVFEYILYVFLLLKNERQIQVNEGEEEMVTTFIS